MPWLAPDLALFQTVHAAADFTTAPWYDSVAVQGTDGETWYAKLLLLFRWGQEQLAFVQWYQTDVRPATQKNDLLVKNGCLKARLVRDYAVIKLQSIQERVRVIPDMTSYMKNPERYKSHPEDFWQYISVFGWDRYPADNRKVQLDEEGCMVYT